MVPMDINNAMPEHIVGVEEFATKKSIHELFSFAMASKMKIEGPKSR